MKTMAKLCVVTALVLAGCATGDMEPELGAPRADGGKPSTDAGTPESSSGEDARPADSGSMPEDTAISGEDADDAGGVDTASADSGTTEPPDGFVATDSGTSTAPDTFVAPPDSFVVPDFGVAPDGGCPPPPTVSPGDGASCAAAIPISMDVTCKQTFTGDTCSGAPSLSTSCGSGQAMIYKLTITSGIRLYNITVSSGFTLATIPGPPFCGGAGGCVGTGMSTGVSSGSTQWWTVLKSGGGCGPYTLTITPS